MIQQEVIDLPIKMHEVQEEYQTHPAYQCVIIQEAHRVTLEMMEEEVDMMGRRRTRLFILTTRQDPLESLMVIRIQMSSSQTFTDVSVYDNQQVG